MGQREKKEKRVNFFDGNNMKVKEGEKKGDKLQIQCEEGSPV